MSQTSTYGSTSRSMDPRSETAAQKLAENAAQKGGEMLTKAGEQFDKVASNVEGAARNVAAHGREMGEQVTVVADNFKGALDKSLRDQPAATIAVVAGLAFVLGALWKS